MPRPKFFDKVVDITGGSHRVHPPHMLDRMSTGAEPEQATTSQVGTEEFTAQSRHSQSVASSK